MNTHILIVFALMLSVIIYYIDLDDREKAHNKFIIIIIVTHLMRINKLCLIFQTTTSMSNTITNSMQ